MQAAAPPYTQASFSCSASPVPLSPVRCYSNLVDSGGSGNSGVQWSAGFSSCNIDVVHRVISTTASRLIKSDLAALAELQRQDQSTLSLHLFSAARRENWYPTDCIIYADMVAVLGRTKMNSEIGQFMAELMVELKMRGGIVAGDLRGPARLVMALVAAEKPRRGRR